MESKELLAQATKVIAETVKPMTHPLGIKMLKEDEELPTKAKRPSAMGTRYAICQAVSAARRYGWTMALGAEDHSCALCSVVLGFGKANTFYREGNLACGMYTETMRAAAVSEAALSKFSFNEYRYAVVGPLDKFTEIPDLVLLYGMPAQVMRLVIGSLYKSGGAITSSFTGRGGYASIIVATMAKNECQVILPGNGERVFGHTQDYEMAFTIPGAKLVEVVEGLSATQKAGVKYPIPSFLNYEAPFPPKYKELDKMWREGKNE